MSLTFGANHIHDIDNRGSTDAVSVHVYGPRLTTMNYYGIESSGRVGLVRTETVDALAEPPV